MNPLSLSPREATESSPAPLSRPGLNLSIPLSGWTRSAAKTEESPRSHPYLPSIGPVFMRPDLTPYRPDYVTRTFNKLARSLGLSPIGCHGLRHSLATTLGEARIPLLTVSRLLGHSSTRVTADVYSHVWPEMAGEVAMAAGKLRGA